LKCPQCLSENWNGLHEHNDAFAPSDADIIAMYDDGMTCTAISIKLGVPYSKVIASVTAEFDGESIRV
jgi:hypothetical protein